MQVTDIGQLTGKNDEFIVTDFGGNKIHQDIVEPLSKLHAAASEHGFDLAIVSGYRNFDRQLAIWNAKARGERAVLDDIGNVIDMMELTPWEQVQSILRWSALPGASRHHWGTDIDIYDKGAVSSSYSPKLTLDEVVDDGPFGLLHCWLDQCIDDSSSFGFFRPYTNDCGGVAPERWHLSYAPLSATFQSQLTIDNLVTAISNESLELKNVVLNHIEEIYQRFVNISSSTYPLKYQKLLFS